MRDVTVKLSAKIQNVVLATDTEENAAAAKAPPGLLELLYGPY